MARISYVELPARDVAGVRRFYEQAFGWSLTDFSPDYAATTGGDVDIGLNGTTDVVPTPFALVAVDDLEQARADIVAAGGPIVRDIYAYPGGRRFHFTDPAGNELGVFQSA